MSLPTMGALIAAVVLGGANPEVGEAVLATAVANNAQQQLTHSRSNEQEADNIGLAMLANANYDPNAMVDFFETLQNKQKMTEFSAPEFLRTHPLTLGRIADARNRATQYGIQKRTNKTYFKLIQARTAALTQRPLPRVQGSSVVKAIDTQDLNAQQYFQALQFAHQGNSAKARELLAQLIKTNEYPVLFHYSAAQVELANDHPQEAYDILTRALAMSPGNLSLIELYAQSLLRLKRAKPALQLLKTTLRKHPDQFRLYQIYAQAASALDQKSEAYRALAEFQYAQGNLHQAVSYLEQALKTPNLATYDRLSLQARQDMMKMEVNRRELSITQEQQK
jgi:predicted Zn-dependent protease